MHVRRPAAVALSAVIGIGAVVLLSIVLSRPSAPSAKATRSNEVAAVSTATLPVGSNVPSTSTTPGPGGAASPMPSPTQAMDPSTPPLPTPTATPPLGYDVRAIHWTGALFAFPFPGGLDGAGVWSSAIDGSDLRRWSASPLTQPIGTFKGGAFWIRFSSDSHHADLYLGRDGRPTRRLIGYVGGSLPVVHDGAIYAVRLNRSREELGLWRFPLDGSRPTMVLPPSAAAARLQMQTISIAVAPDGHSWARTFEGGDLDMGGSSWFTQIRVGDLLWEASLRPVVGFARDGSLVHELAQGLARYDVVRRTDMRIKGVPYGQMTPDGRHLVTVSAGVVTSRDLGTGRSREFRVTDVADSLALRVHDSRYIVLEEDQGSGAYVASSGRHIVLDLQTGWTGTYAPIDPATAAPPKNGTTPGPAPPEGFDTTSIPWAAHGGPLPGDVRSGPGLWSGFIDGSLVAKLPGSEPEAGPVAALPDGRVVYLALPRSEGIVGPLMLGSASGPTTLLENAYAPFALDAARGVVYAGTVAPGSPIAVQRVALDGSAVVALPALPLGRSPGTLVVSTDGSRLVLAGSCEPERRRQSAGVFREGSWVEAKIPGTALGATADGALIYQRGCGDGPVVRSDLDANNETVLLPAGSRARVTPDGRYVIGARSDRAGHTTQVTRAVVDTAERTFFSLPGAWQLTDLGDARYAVLVGVAPWWQWHAVVDLHDGWIGYLPPIRVP